MTYLFTLLLAFSAGAETPVACEQQLVAQEFAREPQGRNGLITQAVPLTPYSIHEAYARGIFPWGDAPEAGFSNWHSPEQRGILFFDELDIGRSDRKAIRRLKESGKYRVTFNQAFNQVIDRCAEMSRFHLNRETGKMEPEGTWISDNFVAAYKDMHRDGLTQSVEVWHGDRLVAGLFGTFIKGVFSGDSMFHDRGEPDVGKLALEELIARLRVEGHTFIDVQVAGEDNATSLAVKWGARNIPRAEYFELLRGVQGRGLSF
jgi:leucyl/phenylalanyl-tRNA--protein transferase